VDEVVPTALLEKPFDIARVRGFAYRCMTAPSNVTQRASEGFEQPSVARFGTLRQVDTYRGLLSVAKHSPAAPITRRHIGTRIASPKSEY